MDNFICLHNEDATWWWMHFTLVINKMNFCRHVTAFYINKKYKCQQINMKIFPVHGAENGTNPFLQHFPALKENWRIYSLSLQWKLLLCVWFIAADILLNVLESRQTKLRKLFMLRLYMRSDRNLAGRCVFFWLLGFSLSFRLSFPMVNTSVVIIPLRSGTVPMLLVWMALMRRL